MHLALHWPPNFLINDEKTVLKALKKIFGKDPAEQPGMQAIETPSNKGEEKQPDRFESTSRAKSSASKPRRASKPSAPSAPAWKLEDFVVEPAEGKTRFHDFKLAPELMHAIQDLGFPYCTPIQAQVLGFTLKGRDAIGRAQTGTGKTAAFLISTITQLLETPPPKERYMGEPRALIIAPTRELVVQI